MTRLTAQKRTTKREAKRLELAQSAISMLSERGFARTSLRDIAAYSDVSVGVIHYYFTDKADLITCCVQLYKDRFVAALDAILDTNAPREILVRNFIRELQNAVERDARTHRLWYDIRGQSLFEPAFQSAVQGIEKSLEQLTGRFLHKANLSHLEPFFVYLTIDGLFRFYLQRQLSGDIAAIADFGQALRTEFRLLTRQSAPP